MMEIILCAPSSFCSYFPTLVGFCEQRACVGVVQTFVHSHSVWCNQIHVLQYKYQLQRSGVIGYPTTHHLYIYSTCKIRYSSRPLGSKALAFEAAVRHYSEGKCSIPV